VTCLHSRWNVDLTAISPVAQKDQKNRTNNDPGNPQFPMPRLANRCIATSAGLLRTASYIRFSYNRVCVRSELSLSQEILNFPG
jgi:hypothetical protein